MPNIRVKGVPTIIVADAQSKEQHRQVGYSSRQTAQEWVAKLIAAVKAGPVEKVANPAPAPKPAKVYKILPGIDLSKFTAKQKTTILERANKERCNFGCKLTVAGCRNDDSSCGTGKKAGR